MAGKISFTKYSMYQSCPWSYKLVYIDKVGIRKKNLHLSFGSAIHESAEKKVLNESINEVEVFSKRYDSEIDGYSENERKDITPGEIADFRHQGIELAPLIVPAVKARFGNKIIGVEKEILAPIEGQNLLFEGFADLILDNAGRIVIIDYKTATKIWGAEKRSDKTLKDQLCFYKHFWSVQNKIDESLIDSCFIILAREAKEKERIEVIQEDISAEDVKNSLIRLNFVIKNINKKLFYKSWEGCKFCQFNHTKHCRP
jgi:hypothetical protein